MEFDHLNYGFKIQDLFKGNEEIEPHCSLVLKLNNVEKLNEETFRLTNCIPLDENLALLKELKKSCKIAIAELVRIKRMHGSREEHRNNKTGDS